MTPFSSDPALLRKLPPLSWLTQTQLRWALPETRHRTYPARTTIIRTGDKAEGLYIVLTGRLRVLHQDGDGHELLTEIVGPHEYFGELGLFDGSDCPVDIESDTACEILYVPRKVVLECLEDNARAAMNMLRTTVSRLCATHRRLGKLALTTVRQRVAMALLENVSEAHGEWRVEVGSEQLAAMVGASREMVSRTLKNLIEKGIVRRVRRKLFVTDRQALAEQIGRGDRPAPTGIGR